MHFWLTCTFLLKSWLHETAPERWPHARVVKLSCAVANTASRLERSVPSSARNAVYSVSTPNSLERRTTSSINSLVRLSTGVDAASDGFLSAPISRIASHNTAMRRLAQSRGTNALRVVAVSRG